MTGQLGLGSERLWSLDKVAPLKIWLFDTDAPVTRTNNRVICLLLGGGLGNGPHALRVEVRKLALLSLAA